MLPHNIGELVPHCVLGSFLECVESVKEPSHEPSPTARVVFSAFFETAFSAKHSFFGFFLFAPKSDRRSSSALISFRYFSFSFLFDARFLARLQRFISLGSTEKCVPTATSVPYFDGAFFNILLELSCAFLRSYFYGHS